MSFNQKKQSLVGANEAYPLGRPNDKLIHQNMRGHLLVAILLLGYSLFVNNLHTEPSLWSDEGWTIAATNSPNPIAMLDEFVIVDVHPPLFFLELGIWRVFVGDTIFEMRYFSLLISLLGITFTYRASKALFGEQAGILAALLYALHDLINVLTHEVRHYPQQMMMVSLALWMYWRFYRQPNRRRGMVFAVSAAALMYTHYWGGFIVVGMALHALITRREKITPFVYVFVATGLLYVPWLPVLYHQITLERPGGLPHALENTNWVYRVLLYQLVGTPELFWLTFALIGAMSAYRLKKWRPSEASGLPLLIAVFTPTLSILINTAYPTLSFRALGVVVPVVIVLVAHGIAQFRLREQLVIVLFVVAFSLTSTDAGPVERPDWPQIAADIIHQIDASDVVLLENDTDEHALAYYLQQLDADISLGYTESTRVFHPDEYDGYLGQVLADKNGIWVAKLGWVDKSHDIRPELYAQGFISTLQPIEYGIYNNRLIQLWRLDRIRADEPLATFGDDLQLLQGDYQQHVDGVTVNMLWSALKVPAQNYTVSVFLMGNGQFMNIDQYPFEPTVTWQAVNTYFDSRFIPTTDLPAGMYQVGVKVYYFADTNFTEIENLPVDNCTDDANCNFIFLGEVNLNE